MRSAVSQVAREKPTPSPAAPNRQMPTATVRGPSPLVTRARVRAPDQRPGSHRPEEKAVGRGPGPEHLAGDVGQQHQQGRRGEREPGGHPEQPQEGRGESGVAHPGGDRLGHGGVLLGNPVGGREGDDHHHHPEVGDGVDAEGHRRPGGGHDDPAEGGPHRPGGVEGGRVQRHRVGHHLAGDEVGDHRHPHRRVEGGPHPEEQAEGEQQRRRDQARPGRSRSCPGPRPAWCTGSRAARCGDWPGRRGRPKAEPGTAAAASWRPPWPTPTPATRRSVPA